MRGLLCLPCAAIVLAACRTADVASSTSRSMPAEREMFPIVVPVGDEPVQSSEPPNVPAAEADEAGLLAEIAASMPTKSQSELLAWLHTPDRLIAGTSNARFSDLLSRYYAAHRRSGHERIRQAIADDVAHPGTTVVTVTLAPPMDDSFATIIRRRWAVPFNVILLGPDATADKLAAALTALERARVEDRDGRPDGHHTVELRGEPWAPRLAARKAEIERLLQELREAPLLSIEHVGAARAIDFRTWPMAQ